jgi:hypothetical protein
MNTDLKILLEFLSHSSAEVSGRGVMEPENHVAVLLERFARGQCSEEERADVCRMLRLHPAWLRWLADRVKFSRRNMPSDEVFETAG